ncbi:unnamed protein product [Cylindrotheca closterium]|uniref:Alpha-type protein kinase domain-containing protein n=1 Tax=Cylindrotheca closterium TaxID=2856 RepID=A0AAD2PU75_9STRA|nr:unnamed protein product [Cylindrotheca closterium]
MEDPPDDKVSGDGFGSLRSTSLLSQLPPQRRHQLQGDQMSPLRNSFGDMNPGGTRTLGSTSLSLSIPSPSQWNQQSRGLQEKTSAASFIQSSSTNVLLGVASAPKPRPRQTIEQIRAAFKGAPRENKKFRSALDEFFAEPPSGRQTMADIRADVVRRQHEERERQINKVRQEVKNSMPALDNSSSLQSDTSIPTENISLVSHTHGRQRRSERKITRKELKKAIKHGQKEAANPGRDGSTRWRYTYNGVVFVTDETSRHEVTSWRIDVNDEDEDDYAPPEVQLAGSECHAVLIIDHSGSMRNSDVIGYDSRAHAVYECLKRDFVREQLKSGVVKDVVVTVISMSNAATVLLHKRPLNGSLIGDLERLSKRRPRSHGNYIPALDKALEVMKADAENTSSLLLLLFSDGAPSDHQSRQCDHGIDVFQINKEIYPEMHHDSKIQANKCKNKITREVREECCQRVKAIGQVFGRDKVIFRTLAFGPPKENFWLLEKMANVLPRGDFQKLGLDASSLKTSFSSLSTSLSTLRSEGSGLRTEGSRLRTEGGDRTLTPRLDKVVDRNQQVDVTSTEISGQDGWWIYAFDDFIGKYEFKGNKTSHGLQKVNLKDGVNGIAFLQHPFAEGAERFVYRCSEIVAQTHHYNSAASKENLAGRCGLRLVAKEAKDMENHHQGRKFHETFARIQSEAAELAQAFTLLLPHARPEWNVTFIKTHIYGCYDRNYKYGQAWILVEPELDGKFTKWNNNGGEIRGRPSAPGKLPPMSDMGFLEEEDSDEDDDEIGAIQNDDIPQAFSHFSYEHSRGRQLVCDLQGVWNADDGFMLTDPVIHHVSLEGKRHTNGATDHSKRGVKKFFETHVCNSLCKRMGLAKRTPDILISGLEN